SDRPSASSAETPAGNAHRPTLAAVASPARPRHYQDVRLRLRRARPNQRDDPADDRPPKKQVHNQYPAEVPLVVPNHRRQKVQQRREQYKHHVTTPFSSSPRELSSSSQLQ